jgi:hypothetical protein
MIKFLFFECEDCCFSFVIKSVLQSNRLLMTSLVPEKTPNERQRTRRIELVKNKTNDSMTRVTLQRIVSVC